MLFSSIMRVDLATFVLFFVTLSFFGVSSLAVQDKSATGQEVHSSQLTSGRPEFGGDAGTTEFRGRSRNLRNKYLASSSGLHHLRTEQHLAQLFRASCLAKCYSPTEEIQLPELDDESQFLTNPVHCTHPACFQCLKCIETNERKICDNLGNRIEDHCWNPDILDEKVNFEMNGGTALAYDGAGDLNFTQGPVFHCSEYIKNESIFNVYYRWEFGNHASTLEKLRAKHSDLIPRVFLVETRLNGTLISNETISSWLISFTVPPFTEFQARITAISPKVVYAPQFTEPLIPANEGRGLDSPDNITVVRIRQNPDVLDHPDLEVLLHWNGGGTERTTTCGYKLHLLGDDYSAIDRIHANESFWFQMSNNTSNGPLKFNETYSLEIIGISDVSNEFSNKTTFKVHIPSCLEFFNHSFTFCSPPTPRNARFIHDKNMATLKISWDAPEFADNYMNQIESYELKLSKLVPFYFGTTPDDLAPSHHLGTPIRNRTVDGNTTLVEFKNFTYEGPIRLGIRAFSLGGHSEFKKFDYYPDEESTGSYEVWILIAFGVLGVLVVGVLLTRLYKYGERGNEKGSRQFQDSGGVTPCPWTQWLPNPSDIKRVLNEDSLTLDRVIGSGFFGVVYKATLYQDGSAKTVAVKFLKDGADALEAKKLPDEFKILAGLEPHPHVMALIGAVKMERSPHPGLVVEYCQGGDLRGYLHDMWHSLHGAGLKFKSTSEHLKHSRTSMNSYLELENTCGGVVEQVQGGDLNARVSAVTNAAYFNPDQAEEDKKRAQFEKNDLNIFLSFALQIALAMEHLSKNQIIHRDLAARNVLVSLDGDKVVLKIADFGLSRDVYELSCYNMETRGSLPFKWLAMECLYRQTYTTKSDVWSYGVLLWEILTYGRSPYPGIENTEVLDYLRKGNRMEQPENCPNPIYDLMLQCWFAEAEHRPDFTVVKLILENMIESLARNADYFQEQEQKVKLNAAVTPNLVINPHYLDTPVGGLRPLGASEGYEVPIRRFDFEPASDLITKNFTSSCLYLRPRHQGVDLDNDADLDCEKLDDSSLENLNSVFVDTHDDGHDIHSSSEHMLPMKISKTRTFLSSMGDGSSSDEMSCSESSVENVHNSLDFDMELKGTFNPSRVPTDLIVIGNRTIPCRKGDFAARFKCPTALY